MVNKEEVTVTVRRSDLDYAISSIYAADQEYCIPSDNCKCDEIASRLNKALNGH